MSQASDIALGFYNSLIRSDDVEKIAKVRMDICEKCPHIVRKPLTRCGKCSCLLSMKTRSIKSQCPIKSWMEIRE